MISRMLLYAALALTLGWAEPPTTGDLPKPVTKAMKRISPDSMRGHLSFLSSDLLEGRNTPSRGLDIAAEYIAAQFRRAGLLPIPNTSSYFQTADWKVRKVNQREATAELTAGESKVALQGSQITTLRLEGLDVAASPVYKATWENLEKIKDLPDGAMDGMLLMVDMPSFNQLRSLAEGERMKAIRKLGELPRTIAKLKPAAMVSFNRDTIGDPDEGQQLIDPAEEKQRQRRMNPSAAVLHSAAVAGIWESLPEGRTDAQLSMKLPKAEEEPVKLRNVIGYLKGSDPELKDTYVLVTSHYDHIGIGEPIDGDRIYNGANDDGSGTVSLIEIATSMAKMTERPKRSIIFMAVFGEEKGLLGSKYYARNPVFPLKKTIADLNLEHLGRTDSDEGPQKARLSPTGYEFSELTEVLKQAGTMTGVEIYNNTRLSDAFFNRSDNAALAEAGIPATTVCVAFEFPDYHGAGDHWEKLDYENMAQVDRTLLATLWLLAERTTPLKWNESNEKTKKYRQP